MPQPTGRPAPSMAPSSPTQAPQLVAFGEPAHQVLYPTHLIPMPMPTPGIPLFAVPEGPNTRPSPFVLPSPMPGAGSPPWPGSPPPHMLGPAVTGPSPMFPSTAGPPTGAAGASPWPNAAAAPMSVPVPVPAAPAPVPIPVPYPASSPPRVPASPPLRPPSISSNPYATLAPGALDHVPVDVRPPWRRVKLAATAIATLLSIISAALVIQARVEYTALAHPTKWDPEVGRVWTPPLAGAPSAATVPIMVVAVTAAALGALAAARVAAKGPRKDFSIKFLSALTTVAAAVAAGLILGATLIVTAKPLTTPGTLATADGLVAIACHSHLSAGDRGAIDDLAHVCTLSIAGAVMGYLGAFAWIAVAGVGARGWYVRTHGK
ncbi:hypothetical protein AMAG_08871 [Allomyces macrogynus ATCC 38327]|uniref:Uncharacterized protein n=1 Tax=Allomyces macrogynus (strain ATCC 38327) TaxID=578462 RepID=A0A0L0SMT5_ALLM3|nr:hypothetical protein AMAG_08871 [Allomyces macrogynus ATCC 38327]|eukprot:KNE63798.1 hypothetical protein AMAG_08871 [Allomyces macrogynus ATCC 38327]